MWINKKAAAAKLGVSTRTVERMADAGKITAHHISIRATRYDEAELDAFVRSTGKRVTT